MQNQAFEEESFDKVLDREFNQQFHKGEAIGMKKGEAVGMEKAKRATLRNLLQKKFNIVLSDEINQKIEAADIETLDLWLENIFDAKSITAFIS